MIDERSSYWSRMPAIFAALALVCGITEAQEGNGEGWPREFSTSGGARVVVFQPQLDALEGNRLSGRAAVSVGLADADSPAFGAIWFEARIATDRDERTVQILDVTVPRVRFADATEEQESALAAVLEKEVPTWELEISLDRVLTALGLADSRRRAAEGLNNDPPEIFFRSTPTILVSLEGEPKLQSIEDTRFQSVVNTPFTIVYDPRASTFYLHASEDVWYAATNIEGPWSVSRSVPRKIRNLIPDDAAAGTPPGGSEASGETPAILVSTVPAELLVTDGEPEYAPFANGELLYVTNTESNIVVEVESQRTFVLLSGRWFHARSLDGPWTFRAADELPASFAAIETDSAMAHLRTWVAGTEEAQEAILDAEIPQTATIKRSATTTVEYDGEPQFAAIEGTELEYAKNTGSQVIRHGDSYYVADDGVWYVGSGPGGPFTVATEVPEEIYKQPATSPLYNTTYVYVYDSTPEVVFVGYYPGYLYSFPSHGCLVWGTGWHHSPWWGSAFHPWHSSWGFHASWNPWGGWGFGFSWSSGPFTFGMSTGWSSWHSSAWWGPAGFWPASSAWNRGWSAGAASGFRAGYQAGRRDQFRRNQNLYNRAGNQGRLAPSTRSTAANRAAASGRQPNNVFADRSGNVHRRAQDGSWQQRDQGQWRTSDAATSARSRAGDASTRQRATQRSAPQQRAGSLNRDFSARQRGSARTQSFRGGAGRSLGGRRR